MFKHSIEPSEHQRGQRLKAASPAVDFGPGHRSPEGRFRNRSSLVSSSVRIPTYRMPAAGNGGAFQSAMWSGKPMAGSAPSVSMGMSYAGGGHFPGAAPPTSGMRGIRRVTRVEDVAEFPQESWTGIRCPRRAARPAGFRGERKDPLCRPSSLCSGPARGPRPDDYRVSKVARSGSRRTPAGDAPRPAAGV